MEFSVWVVVFQVVVLVVWYSDLGLVVVFGEGGSPGAVEAELAICCFHLRF